MLYGGNDTTEGTVEVCFDNIWGLISLNGWTTSDAIVVCNQLGLDTNGKYNYTTIVILIIITLLEISKLMTMMLLM